MDRSGHWVDVLYDEADIELAIHRSIQLGLLVGNSHNCMFELGLSDASLGIWLNLFQIVGVSAQIFLQLSVENGMGQHMADLMEEPQRLVRSLKWSWAFQLVRKIQIPRRLSISLTSSIDIQLAIASSVIGKLAIIAFLLAIRGHQSRKPWFLWSVAISIIAINAAVWGTILNQCSPVAKLWDISIPGECNNRLLNQNYSYFQASK